MLVPFVKSSSEWNTFGNTVEIQLDIQVLIHQKLQLQLNKINIMY